MELVQKDYAIRCCSLFSTVRLQQWQSISCHLLTFNSVENRKNALLEIDSRITRDLQSYKETDKHNKNQYG